MRFAPCAVWPDERSVAMSRGMFTVEMLAEEWSKKANAGNVAVREPVTWPWPPGRQARQRTRAAGAGSSPAGFTGKTIIVKMEPDSGIGRATASRIAREGTRHRC